MIDRLQTIFYWLNIWTWIRLALFIVTSRDVRGLENIPRKGGLILTCNHFSVGDPPVLTGVFPRRIAWMAKQELFDFPIFGKLYNMGGLHPRPAVRRRLARHTQISGGAAPRSRAGDVPGGDAQRWQAGYRRAGDGSDCAAHGSAYPPGRHLGHGAREVTQRPPPTDARPYSVRRAISAAPACKDHERECRRWNARDHAPHCRSAAA